jgi:hypothetical protein
LGNLKHYLEALENYSINFSPNFITPLARDLSVRQILSIRSMSIFAFVFAMFLLLLTQFRIIWLLMRKARAKFASKDSNY